MGIELLKVSLGYAKQEQHITYITMKTPKTFVSINISSFEMPLHFGIAKRRIDWIYDRTLGCKRK